MFEKILVPTDFSPYARKVMGCVEDIPGVKEIVLLNVVSRPEITRVWDPMNEIKSTEKKLAEEKKFIKSNIIVKTRVVSVIGSEIAGAIQKVVDEEMPSLVVMGARGKSLIQSALLGSVSRNMLRFGDTHLLIMRYKTLGGAKGLEFTGAKGTRGLRDETAELPLMEKFCTRLFSRVLVPTDFSLPEEAAISFLKSIPDIEEIHLLHVVSKGESRDEIDVSVKNAKAILENIRENLSDSGIKAITHIVVGSPVEEIRAMAEEADVSLIAMSSVGKDTMQTGRIGSRTYDVANTANRPVLVIRMKPIFALPAA